MISTIFIKKLSCPTSAILAYRGQFAIAGDKVIELENSLIILPFIREKAKNERIRTYH